MRPPHPGEYLREEVLPGLRMSVTDLAEHLGVHRVAMSRLVNEHQGISMDMAARLGQAFGQPTRFWAMLQFEHDLWIAESEKPPNVKRLRWENWKPKK